MSRDNVVEFIRRVRGGESPAEAQAQVSMSDAEIDDMVTMIYAITENEHFGNSLYDWTVIKRIDAHERAMQGAIEALQGDIAGMRTTTFHLAEEVNRLADLMDPPPRVIVDAETKVLNLAKRLHKPRGGA